MGQKGFFDIERRLEAISAKGDPLEAIKKIVRWEDFRSDIEAVTDTKPEERKSSAGRRPYDAILKFKVLVLQSLHNLSDEQTEYLIRDRLSFMRFLDLELEDAVPDATTIWLFREALAQAGLIDRLFERFGQHLEAEGYIARGGQIIDATIVSVPKQRNTKEENEAIKAGKTPEGWEKQPAKDAQKDKDARWTKKNDESFYGYKNHVGVDKAHNLIRKWDATDAAVHDSEAGRCARSLQHWQGGLGGQRLPLGPDRGGPEGEELAEPYPPARRTQSSAVRPSEVGEHDALEGARPCRTRIRPPAELDGRQDRAHHWHRAGEVQDRDDESRLQYPPAGSARANGGFARLSALTGGVRVASCKGPRGCRPGVKTVPDRGLTLTRALHPARSAKPEIAESGYCSRFPLVKATLERGSYNDQDTRP
jgi:transposase, IS5 family